MSIEPATEIFIVRQLQEVPISSKEDEVSKLYYFSLKYLNRRRTNQDHMLLALTLVSI